MDRLRLSALVFGHALVDCYMALLLPLIPNIRERLGISQEQIGYLVVWVSLSSSLAQPIFGWLSDRTRGAYLIGAGVALTGIGMATFGVATHYWPMILLLSLAGIGCGAFHPAGAALAARAGGRRRDLALGLFSPGGLVGYSAGPVLAVWLYQRLGLAHMWPAMSVALLAGPAIGWLAAGLEGRGRREGEAVPHPVDRNGELLPRAARLRVLAVVLAVVVLRSAVVIAFTNFLAQLLQDRGVAEASRGWWTSAFVFAGGAAGIAGGYLAERVGRRRLTVATLALTAPALFLFLHLGGPFAWAGLLLGGALAQAALPVNIAQAQLLLPTRQSLASALTMGFCWGLASFLAPVVGRVADHTTLPYALSLVCVVPLVGALLGGLVPDFRPPGHGLVEPPSLPPSPLETAEEA